MEGMVKRVFGLLAILVGAGLLIMGIGQTWIFPGERFRVRPLIGGLIFGLFLISTGRKWLFNLIALDVLPVEPGNPEIAEASRRARATMPKFWDYLAQNRYQCFVKFPMQTADGRIEHIWAVVHSRTDDSVVVSLANDPVGQPADAAQRRVVPTNDLEDWQVMISESEIRGGYSIQALERIAKSRGQRLSRADQRRLQPFVDREPA